LLAKTSKTRPDSLRDSKGCIDDYEQNFTEITVDRVDEHLFSSFPAVYAVAKSIVHWNILDITDEEMLKAVNLCEKLCFDFYFDSKGTGDSIMPVVQYVINNFDYFLEIPQADLDDAALRKAPGFYKKDTDGRIIEIQIEPTRFRKEMARFGLTRVLHACDDAKYLIRDRGSFEKKSQIRPGEDVRKYMYRFDISISDYKVK